MPNTRHVIWLPGAVADLSRLREFLLLRNPAAARRAATQIQEATKILQDYPEVGRPVEDLPAFRELIIPFGHGAYVLRYRVEEPTVVVVRIWHSREVRE